MNMKEKLEYLRSHSIRCEDRELANMTSEIYFGSQKPEFPINIFKVLNDFGVQYKFMKLENLEGVYSPDTDSLVAVVGINYDRRYERQRFTAAHELCHHLKDYKRASASPIGSEDPMEIYANKFATEFLMPRRYFLEEVDKLKDDNGFIQPENALKLAFIFGVSFRNVIWNLHNYSLLEFKPSEEFFEQFGIVNKIEELDLKSLDTFYLKNIIDSYKYIPQPDTSPLWFRLKNELIYNDNRIEGLDIEKETVAEICTDLRLNRHDSSYYQAYKEDKNIVETVGHIGVYEYIINADETPDRYQLKELNKILFSLAPQAHLMGEFRQSNNEITGAVIDTSHYESIQEHLYFLDIEIEECISLKDNYSFSDWLIFAVRIHHRLAQIHPFGDGNGRVSRAVMNWILKLKDLPPVYIETKDKDLYLEGMKEADLNNFERLNKFFLERLLFSMVKLNERTAVNTPQYA